MNSIFLFMIPKDQGRILMAKKINFEVTAAYTEVFCINENGEKLGIIKATYANKLAYEAGLDLVCINENSTPVVCKIMDYNKYNYEQKKKEKESKKAQVKIEVKEIQMRPQIGDSDLQVRIKKANEELSKGNRIRINISFKGRQVSHPEFGFSLLEKFIAGLENAEIYKPGELSGNRIESIIYPKKKG